MRHLNFSGLVVAVVCLALPGLACLNDRDSDTLATQGAGLPDTVKVVTGRFDRNPPLYYSLRVNRVTKELQANPKKLALYDDIAVACDRLHRDAEAIAWMKRKRQHLPRPEDKRPAMREQWYRYHANLGTFLVHRWLRAGADRRKIGAVKVARDHIARALKLKPNAHFGRERYQLLAMQWIIDPYNHDETRIPKVLSFSEYLEHHDSGVPTARVEGLAGIIVLGAAWESVDIYEALAHALDKAGKPSLAQFAYRRCDELIKQGKRSLRPGSGTGTALQSDLVKQVFGVDRRNVANLDTKFIALRKEADSWQQQRTNFMLAALKGGRHPDTDKQFWQGYQPGAAPSLEMEWYDARDEQDVQLKLALIIGLGVLLLPTYLYVRFWRRAKP